MNTYIGHIKRCFPAFMAAFLFSACDYSGSSYEYDTYVIPINIDYTNSNVRIDKEILYRVRADLAVIPFKDKYYMPGKEGSTETKDGLKAELSKVKEGYELQMETDELKAVEVELPFQRIKLLNMPETAVSYDSKDKAVSLSYPENQKLLG